jgi:DNA-directed RNA polymerase specialized sigma24 family protein
MDTKTLDDLASLVFSGDQKAYAELWERIMPAVKKAVGGYAKNSKWVDSKREDIEQGVLLAYPVFIKRYDPSKQKKDYGFSEWLYHTLSRVVQDVIRREKDTLGVGIPQKSDCYPEWFHLGSVNDCPEIVSAGRENMRRGLRPVLGPQERPNAFDPKYKEREHEVNYHGRGRFND